MRASRRVWKPGGHKEADARDPVKGAPPTDLDLM